MFLVSIDLESDKKILSKINKRKKSFTIFSEGNIDNCLKNKKNKYVVVDQDDRNIDKYLKKNKRVIVFDYLGNRNLKKYASNNNVTVCNSEGKLIDLINEKMIHQQNKANNLLLTAVGCVLLCVAAISALNYKEKLDKERKKEEEKSKTVAKVDTPKNIYQNENFVFLGDSITDFYDLEKFYGDLPVVNSGNSGDRYPNLLDNLQERVIKYNPTTVFLLIGTNDICYSDVTNEELVDKIMEICEKIHEMRPHTKIYVESIYPVNKDTSDNDKVIDWMVNTRENDRIKKINALLEERVNETKYVNYINFYDDLLDDSGDLNINYTTDGLHMSDEGYEVITRRIKGIIESDMKKV